MDGLRLYVLLPYLLLRRAVLKRVRDFLPKLASANEELAEKAQTQPAGSLDIETLTDPDGAHIEMVRGRGRASARTNGIVSLWL